MQLSHLKIVWSFQDLFLRMYSFPPSCTILALSCNFIYLPVWFLQLHIPSSLVFSFYFFFFFAKELQVVGPQITCNFCPSWLQIIGSCNCLSLGSIFFFFLEQLTGVGETATHVFHFFFFNDFYFFHYSWFTVFYQFLLYIRVTQSHIYLHSFSHIILHHVTS